VVVVGQCSIDGGFDPWKIESVGFEFCFANRAQERVGTGGPQRTWNIKSRFVGELNPDNFIRFVGRTEVSGSPRLLQSDREYEFVGEIRN
jgi:hypothetical protein